MDKGLKGKSKQPSQIADPELYFSFTLSLKSDSHKKGFSSITQPLHLVFTGCCFGETKPVPEDNSSKPKICEELLCRTEGYERHLHDRTGPTNLGFLLRRAPCSALKAKASNRILQLSLSDLVVSRHADLRSFDRFLIAANLACSLVHFYSSP